MQKTETMRNREREVNNIIAIDAVIVPSPTVRDVAISLSENLHGSPITLGRNDYFPHITLAMGYIGDIKDAQRAMAEIASSNDSLEVVIDALTTSQKPFEGHYFSHFGIKNDPKITDLHRLIVTGLPFVEGASVSSSNFVHEEGEEIVPAVFKYIGDFASLHSGDKYWPHITLGAGEGDLRASLPMKFTVDTIQLFQLGNFCTCRKPLGQWKLAKK